MNISKEILKQCQIHFDDIVKIRRDIHMHPELGFEVTRTAGIAAVALEKLGIAVKTGIGKTGVVGDLIVPGATKTIALRADMDALPMQEMRNPEYKSKFDGKAHMCGHDSHTAMLIGAARVLSALKDQLSVNVRFIFQPNEENLPGGAPAMIKDGALDGVDEIFGLHVWPLVETGKIGISSGPLMGQPDTFSIEINGIGGHAAVPHASIDPIVIGAQFVSDLQSIVSRYVDPFDPAVVSVTQFHAGSTHNVIPAIAEISGTVRTFKYETKLMIKDKIEKLIAGLTQANNAEYTFKYYDGYPVCINHPDATAKAQQAASAIIGADNLVPAIPILGGEDFAYYAEKIPACFAFLGIRNEAKDIIYMCHDPRFDIDEDAMTQGMALHASIALNYSNAE